MTIGTRLRGHARALRYAWRFQTSLRRLRTSTERAIEAIADSPSPDASLDDLWQRVQSSAPAVRAKVLSLASPRLRMACEVHWQRHRGLYQRIGHGREKALEHGLTFSLTDFGRVRRHCDVAAAASPIERVMQTDYPDVEYWKQDIAYTTNLAGRIIGGPAECMVSLVSAPFDLLTLHCSFEHFEGTADSRFVGALDKLLSSSGVCLILPLYVAEVPRVYFDPTAVTTSDLATFDADAELTPLRGYGQRHGRFYSPRSLAARVIDHLPNGIVATVVRFTDLDVLDSDLYLHFALALHRPGCFLEEP